MGGLDRDTLLALGAMALAVFVIANDLTALSVALPAIENDFDSDVSTVQWVINAYALVFGVLIVTGGRLADMFGRRRLFFVGAAIFATFSLLAGAAQGELWLILCRALMGIGGAIIWPAVLGMTYDVLPDDKAGIASISIGLVALLVALDQVTQWGWSDPRILFLFALCAVLLTAFGVVERRAGAAALIPRDVMANPRFRAACITTLFMSAVFFAALLFLPQFFQKILSYSPLEAGAALLPLMAVFAVTSFVAGSLYERLGAKLIVSAGAVCLTLGAFLVSLIDRDSGFVSLVPGMVVMGLGVGLFYSSITTAAVTALDPSRASLAGGIVYMFQIAGGSVGLGLTTTVFITASEDRLQSDLSGSGLSGEEVDTLHGALAGTESAGEILARFSERTAERLIELVRDAFAAGIQWSFRLVAALALCGLVVSVLFVGGSLLRRREEPAPSPGTTA